MTDRPLAKNVVLSLLAQVIPLPLALLVIPPLLARLGEERFGALLLAWAAIGYFSLFDLGLGRALTQAAAARLGAGRDDKVAPLAWNALYAMLALGGLGGLVLALLAPVLVASPAVPAALAAESRMALYVLAASLPVVVSGSGLRGLLEARQAFAAVTVVRIALGALLFLGPLAASMVTTSLAWSVATLAAARLLGWVAYLALALSTVPGFQRIARPAPEMVGPLLRSGGWMTVSNVIGPLMVYLDRFLVGAWLSPAAVAWYATPYEAVTRLWVVPAAVNTAFFPALAAEHGRGGAGARRLIGRGVLFIALALLLPAAAAIAFPSPLLTLWLGAEMAARSSAVLAWLAAGVFLNSLAQVPFTYLQAVGRADLTARLHLAEAPLYLVLLAFLLARFGVAGVAAAWTLRIAVDGLLLFWLTARVLRAGRPAPA